ncbi:hypothetical protein [Nocardia neocaledoniensis]|uniref:hypothetical protein n=1 Tax=Nocardia neocaledoniensis TaxID=236511 RepID=UPI0024578F48|nr:hypothetical protein [Nocardia neocaledoniensis]
MPARSEIARLFDRRPKRWGADGDPAAWDALRDRMCALPVPTDATEFGAVLRQEFTRLAGVDVEDSTAPSEVDAGGYPVHPETWRTILLPLLTTRARQLYGEIPTERP